MLAPAKSAVEMQRIALNDVVDAGLCALFLFVVVTILVSAVRSCMAARVADHVSTCEIGLATVHAS